MLPEAGGLVAGAWEKSQPCDSLLQRKLALTSHISTKALSISLFFRGFCSSANDTLRPSLMAIIVGQAGLESET